MKSAIFTQTTVTTQAWATAQMLTEVQLHLQSFEGRRELLRKGYTDNVQYALGWIIHRMDPATVAEILNQLSADEQYLQVIVGKLALRLDIGMLPVIPFHYEEIKSIAAFQLIQSLIDLGYITATSKVKQSRNEDTGKVAWATIVTLSFGAALPENELFIHGVHQTPGIVLQKRMKVRTGGKALKLNKVERDYLRNVASMELRLIDIDPEEIRAYITESVWYQSSLTHENPFQRLDKLVLNEVVDRQVQKFRLLQQEPSFYLSVWMDYRTRTYYDMSELGFNPHGKQFETSLYELATPIIIDENGADALKYSAVCIIDGRTQHHTAIERFDASREHYITALRIDTGDRGENLYNSRLAQAIEDYYSGTPSHFLLSEDATNGGLQHGGIGFKSPKMMTASNVGGAPDQLDSHQLGADAFDMDRDEYKKLVSQGLFHGESLRSIASKLDLTMSELKSHLIEGFGTEVFNIQSIADWGVAVASNENPSLMWYTRDGFRAQSIAYTESVPLEIHALTYSTTKGFSQTKIHKEMPIIKDAKGNPIYGSVGDDKSYGNHNKLRGLYANATHSIDATALRDVSRALLAAGQYGFYKHDNFLVHPNNMHIVRAAYREALIAEFHFSSYESAINDIVENVSGSKPPKPTLFMGTATVDMIVNSHYFLSA